MKCTILLIGSELLNGMMVDTNSIFIAEILNKYGIEIVNKIVVGDKIDDIVNSIKYAKNNSQLIIASGGLGPTIDDITREAVAKALNKELLYEETRFNEMKIKYKNSFNITKNNERQFMFPEGSIIIENEKGSAPGFIVDDIACFPGVPFELHDMFPKFISKYVVDKGIEDKFYINDILTWDIPESFLETEIIDIVNSEPDIFTEFLAKDYGLLVRLIAKQDMKARVESMKEKIYNKIGNYIFGENSDRLDTIVIKKIAEKNFKLSVAESCTGGLLSSIILSNSGASSVYEEGYITYSNNSKVKNLNVDSETIDKYGAVSEETVYEMLKGLKTEIGIAISGVAGPNGGTLEKPVGTVYIGTKIIDKYLVKKYNFRGDRDNIRRRAAYSGLNLLRINL